MISAGRAASVVVNSSAGTRDEPFFFLLRMALAGGIGINVGLCDEEHEVSFCCVLCLVG